MCPDYLGREQIRGHEKTGREPKARIAFFGSISAGLPMIRRRELSIYTIICNGS